MSPGSPTLSPSGKIQWPVAPAHWECWGQSLSLAPNEPLSRSRPFDSNYRLTGQSTAFRRFQNLNLELRLAEFGWDQKSYFLSIETILWSCGPFLLTELNILVSATNFGWIFLRGIFSPHLARSRIIDGFWLLKLVLVGSWTSTLSVEIDSEARFAHFHLKLSDANFYWGLFTREITQKLLNKVWLLNIQH